MHKRKPHLRNLPSRATEINCKALPLDTSRLRRQFLLVCLSSIDLVGVLPPKTEWGDPQFDPGSCLTAGLNGIEEDAFIFQRSPQSFDEDVVHPAATTIHRDTDVGIPQGVGEGKAGELRALSTGRRNAISYASVSVASTAAVLGLLHWAAQRVR